MRDALAGNRAPLGAPQALCSKNPSPNQDWIPDAPLREIHRVGILPRTPHGSSSREMAPDAAAATGEKSARVAVLLSPARLLTVPTLRGATSQAILFDRIQRTRGDNNSSFSYDERKR